MFAIVLFAANQSWSHIFECEFDYELLFDDLKVGYTCKVDKTEGREKRPTFFLTNKSHQTIANVTAYNKHLDRNTNDDVTQLYIMNQNMTYFPRGVTRFFHNIVAVHAGMNRLKFLEKDDLKEFTEMRFLYLYTNLLEVLQSDVFQYTQALEYVSFYNNRLMHIGSKILLPLVKLKTAYFNKNICIDKQAVSSEQGISEIRLEIAERCSDITDEDLMNELKSNSDKIDKLEQKVSEVGKQLDMITEMMKTVMPKDKI